LPGIASTGTEIKVLQGDFRQRVWPLQVFLIRENITPEAQKDKGNLINQNAVSLSFINLRSP